MNSVARYIVTGFVSVPRTRPKRTESFIHRTAAIDPTSAKESAIASLAKVGFTKVTIEDVRLTDDFMREKARVDALLAEMDRSIKAENSDTTKPVHKGRGRRKKSEEV